MTAPDHIHKKRAEKRVGLHYNHFYRAALVFIGLAAPPAAKNRRFFLPIAKVGLAYGCLVVNLDVACFGRVAVLMAGVVGESLGSKS
jgi:hypothetical protein